MALRKLNFTDEEYAKVMNDMGVSLNKHHLYPGKELTEQDIDDLRSSAIDLMRFTEKLEKHISEQFITGAVKYCTNEKCGRTFGYYYDDFHYCPNCGSKLLGPVYDPDR